MTVRSTNTSPILPKTSERCSISYSNSRRTRRGRRAGSICRNSLRPTKGAWVDTGYCCKQILLIVPAKFCDHTHPGRRRQVANLGSHTLFLAGVHFPAFTHFLPVFPRGYCPALHGVDPRNLAAPPPLGANQLNIVMLWNEPFKEPPVAPRCSPPQETLHVGHNRQAIRHALSGCATT
jgi:hypothetical protein